MSDRLDKDIFERDEKVIEKIDRRDNRVAREQHREDRVIDDHTADEGSDAKNGRLTDDREQDVTNLQQKQDDRVLKEDRKDLERAAELNRDDLIREIHHNEVNREYDQYRIEKRNEHAEKRSGLESDVVLEVEKLEREFVDHENEHDQYLIDRLSEGEASEKDKKEIARLQAKIDRRKQWLEEKTQGQTDRLSEHQAKVAAKVLKADAKDFDKEQV